VSDPAQVIKGLGELKPGASAHPSLGRTQIINVFWPPKC